jgi:tetratricopeptide (TPR) repeat protein
MSEKRPSSWRETLFIFNPFAALLVLATLILVVAFFTIAWKRVLHVEPGKNIDTESSQCSQFRELAQNQRQRFEKLDTGDLTTLLTPKQTEAAGELLKNRARFIAECQLGHEADDWYGSLRQRYETTLSVEKMTQSAQAEKEGREALLSGDYATAGQRFRTAIQFQERINVDFPTSTYANISRQHTLERLANEASYRPNIAIYQKFKETGDLSYDKGDYEAARESYTKALGQLRSMLYKIPPSFFDCDEKTRFLENRCAEINARIRSAEVDALVEQAKRAASGGDYDKAAVLFSNALERHLSIAKDFPQSSMASPARRNIINKERQNTLSQPVERRLQSDLAELSAFLEANDDNSVQNAICKAQGTYSDLLRLYSDSDAAKNPSYKKIPFLFSVRSDVCLLRKAVMEHLREIPGDASWKMLDREVSQLIFVKICSTNPSARKADTLPVEGVTLAEARLFANRLSWIVGSDVSLPDLARYEAVARPVDATWVRKGTWNSVTAKEREVQPVATSTPDARGYYDLLGNVSEWLEPGSGDDTRALIIGGSARDNPIRLSEIPRDLHDTNERIRNNGFRVIVKTGGK